MNKDFVLADFIGKIKVFKIKKNVFLNSIDLIFKLPVLLNKAKNNFIFFKNFNGLLWLYKNKHSTKSISNFW